MISPVTRIFSLSLYRPEARSVGIAADYNGWKAEPMERRADGTWSGRTPPLEVMPLTPVRVRYKFVIDGHLWIRDPDNPLEVAGDSAIELEPYAPGPPPERGWVEEVSFYSTALGKSMRYLAWLPPGYDRGGRYPVLYLLHGYRDGGMTDFLVKGQIDRVSEMLLAAGRIPPMIVVMVDGEDSFYSDAFDGSAPYERYLTSDLIDAVDGRYRTFDERRGRGIGGLSMGGFGAAKLALQYPDRFRSVGAHAGLYDVRDPEMLPSIFGDGAHHLGHRRWNSPIALIEERHRFHDLALYFDCGDRDHLLPQALRFREALETAGIPHRFELRTGHHAWDFVQRRLPEALEWHGHALRRAELP